MDLDLSEMDLSRVDLSEARLERVSLRKANLEGGSLMRAALVDCDLSGMDWAETTVWETRFETCNLSENDFSALASRSGEDSDPPSVVQSVFIGCKLNSSDLLGVCLFGATFENCIMQGADLGVADLREARFDGSDLRGSHLQGARITKSCWKGCDLTDAKLGKRKPSRFKGARFDSVGEHLSADAVLALREARQIATFGEATQFLRESREIFSSSDKAPKALSDEVKQEIDDAFLRLTPPAAHPDDKRGALNKKIKRYGEALRELHSVKLGDEVKAVVFTEDGKTIKAFAKDGIISAVATGDYRRHDDASVDLSGVEVHEILGLSVCVSPKGRYVAWSGLHTVRVFSVVDLECIGSYEFEGLVEVAVSDTGELVAVCNDSVGFVSDEGKRSSIDLPIDSICAAFSSDGSRVAFAGEKSAIVYDLAAEKFSPPMDRAKTKWPETLEFSSDGTRLSLVSGDALEVWQLGEGNNAKSHGFKADSPCFVIAGDVALVATGSDIRCVNTQTMKAAAKTACNGPTFDAIALSPDNRTIAIVTTSFDGATLRVWQALEERPATQAAASPAVNEKTRKTKKKGATAKEKQSASRAPSLAAQKRWVNSLQYKKKLGPLDTGLGAKYGTLVGDRVLYPSDRGIVVVDKSTFESKAWKKTPPKSVQVMVEGAFLKSAVSEDGRYAAVVRSIDWEAGGECAVVDLQSNKIVAEWTGAEELQSCAISADGGAAAFGTESGTVLQYSRANGKIEAANLHDGQVRCLTIGPDGDTLISGDLSGSIAVSSLANPGELQRFELGPFLAAHFLSN
ncbi:MAG: hypothetical protein GY811_06725 [Myxococcales bacterium]|nr:hypothetical protein [Myxococcales bacterium]